jgi:hypothetical protein
MRDERRIIIVEEDSKSSEGWAKVSSTVFVVVMAIALIDRGLTMAWATVVGWFNKAFRGAASIVTTSGAVLLGRVSPFDKPDPEAHARPTSTGSGTVSFSTSAILSLPRAESPDPFAIFA